MISSRELLINILKDASDDDDDFVLIHKRLKLNNVALYTTSDIKTGKKLLKEVSKG